jgi:hypothetical protein
MIGEPQIYPAVQNMLLAARALGLGATLTTLYLQFEKEAEAALGLPPGVHSYALLRLRTKSAGRGMTMASHKVEEKMADHDVSARVSVSVRETVAAEHRDMLIVCHLHPLLSRCSRPRSLVARRICEPRGARVHWVRSNTRDAGKSTLGSPRLIRRSAWSIDRMTVPARQIAKNTRMSSSISSALPTASVQNRRSSQGIWSPPFCFLQD